MGKTRLIPTCPGRSYVICSEDPSKLDSALKVSDNFVYDEVNSTEGPKLLAQLEAALTEAKRGIAAGEYQTVVWDTLSGFSTLLINAELEAANADGRRAYSVHNKRLWSAMSRFLALKAHRVCMSHDYPVSGTMDGQLKKTGDGILPAVEGSIRAKIPGMFADVVYLTKKMGSEERVIHTSIAGVFGIGVNSPKAPVTQIAPDVAGFWALSGKAAPTLENTAKAAAARSKPVAAPAASKTKSAPR
jgi:hypothetical protein